MRVPTIVGSWLRGAKKCLYGALLAAVTLRGVAFGQVAQFQSQQGTINSIQSQLNSLKASLPAIGSAGQFEATSTNGTVVFVTLSGDISCSTTTPGNCSMVGSATTVMNANSITGAGTAPTITKFSINGQNNLGAQVGTAASLTTATVNTTASSTSATVNAIGDFGVVSSTVVIRHGGAASALTTPVGLTVQPITYDADDRVNVNGCTVDGSNTNCTTSWTFQVVLTDGLGGTTAPSAAVTITTGPANPGVSNEIDLQWTNQTAAKGIRVYGCSGAACTPALIAAIPNIWLNTARTVNGTNPLNIGCQGCATPANGEYMYIGHSIGTDNVDGTVLPTGAERDDLYTSITAVAGTTVTLAAAPSVSASLSMFHDNAPALQALLNAAPNNSGGTDIYIPPSPSGSCWPIAKTISFYRKAGVGIHGASADGGFANNINLCWVGGAGDTMFNMNQTRDDIFEKFGIRGDLTGTSTPGFVFDVDNIDVGDGLVTTPTHNTWRDIKIGTGGVVWSFGNRASGNVESMLVEHCNTATEAAAGDHWMVVYYASASATNLERFVFDDIVGADAGFFSNPGGELDAFSNNYSRLGTIYWANGILNGHGISDLAGHAESVGRLLSVSNGVSQPVVSLVSFKSLTYTVSPPATGSPLTTLPGDQAFLVDIHGVGVMLQGCKFERNGTPQQPLRAVFTNTTFGSGTTPLVSIGNFYSDPNWLQPATINGAATNGLVSFYDTIKGPDSIVGYWSHARLMGNHEIQNLFGTNIVKVTDPPAPTIANVGTVGVTSYTYFVVGNTYLGKQTVPSPAGTTTTGNVTLSATNYNTITVLANTDGIWFYDVLKGTTATTIGKLYCPMNEGANGESCVFKDTGQATSAYTAPTRNGTGDLIASLNGQVNVQTYGAKCDGVTDDTTAMRNAFAQACGATNGSSVFIPSGTCVTNPVQLTCSNLLIYGVGPSSIVKLKNSATALVITGVGTAYGPFVPASGSPSPTVSNVTFQDFAIDGNKANQTVDNTSGEGTQSTIWLNLASSVTIRNMYIHDATSDCVYNNGGTSAITNQSVIDNRIENCGTGTTTGGRGIDLGQSPQGVKISRNYITGTLKQAIVVQNEGAQGIKAQDIDIGDNVLIGNNTSAGSAGGIDVTDNVVSTIPTTNVLTQRVRVHDNVLDGNSGIGIRLSENTVANASGAVGEMDDPVVQNNTVEGATVVGSASIQVLTTNGGLIKRPVILGNKTNTGTGTATIGINLAGAGVSSAFVSANHIFGVSAANTITTTSTGPLIGCNMLDQVNPNMECGGANQTVIANSGMLLDNATLTGNLGGNGKTITSVILGLASTTFASLGTPVNGTQTYCSDCTIANPCAGAGTGAFAKRINGAWICN